MSRLYASLVFGLVACGGGSSTTIDAAKAIDAAKLIDAPAVVIDAPMAHADAAPAMGTMHHYVISHEALPQTTTEARNSALDLNGDNMVDNQFGMVIATFAGQGIPTQTAVDTAFSHGTTILLASLETTDFATATAAGFMTYAGANPNPPACTGSSDTVCGHHLTGTATFDIATGATIDPLLVGNFAGGTLTTPVGDSTMPLPLSFGGSAFTVNMIGARVQVTAASATGFTAILAGGIPQTQIDGVVYPALQAGFMAAVTANCTQLANPPSCGCTASSQGASAIQLFDANHDCAISLAEIQSNALVTALFATDLTINGMKAMSVGVTVTAVGATFTQP